MKCGVSVLTVGGLGAECRSRGGISFKSCHTAAQCSITSNTQTLLGDQAISGLTHGDNQPIEDVVDLLGQYTFSGQLREVDSVECGRVEIPDRKANFGNQNTVGGVRIWGVITTGNSSFCFCNSVEKPVKTVKGCRTSTQRQVVYPNRCEDVGHLVPWPRTYQAILFSQPVSNPLARN